ncbi:uncharacterized protein LOC103004255 [Balaenoptera acutorostrata]|uniref:Uncharacterized protein LOC103004255 n=1 Tax=Balaenoptera acutorostrata TaxID=9767 RepID=A0A452CK98_BALAC|nr:uncharacterized protein LOC103004255 [Balaenoptera acutorostrata]
MVSPPSQEPQANSPHTETLQREERPTGPADSELTHRSSWVSNLLAFGPELTPSLCRVSSLLTLGLRIIEVCLRAWGRGDGRLCCPKGSLGEEARSAPWASVEPPVSRALEQKCFLQSGRVRPGFPGPKARTALLGPPSSAPPMDPENVTTWARVRPGRLPAQCGCAQRTDIFWRQKNLAPFLMCLPRGSPAWQRGSWHLSLADTARGARGRPVGGVHPDLGGNAGVGTVAWTERCLVQGPLTTR